MANHQSGRPWLRGWITLMHLTGQQCFAGWTPLPQSLLFMYHQVWGAEHLRTIILVEGNKLEGCDVRGPGYERLLNSAPTNPLGDPNLMETHKLVKSLGFSYSPLLVGTHLLLPVSSTKFQPPSPLPMLIQQDVPKLFSKYETEQQCMLSHKAPPPAPVFSPLCPRTV